MADLSAGSGSSRKYPAVMDDPSPYSGSQGYHYHVSVILACALPILPERSHIGIISRLDLHPVQKL